MDLTIFMDLLEKQLVHMNRQFMLLPDVYSYGSDNFHGFARKTARPYE